MYVFRQTALESALNTDEETLFIHRLLLPNYCQLVEWVYQTMETTVYYFETRSFSYTFLIYSLYVSHILTSYEQIYNIAGQECYMRMEVCISHPMVLLWLCLHGQPNSDLFATNWSLDQIRPFANNWTKYLNLSSCVNTAIAYKNKTFGKLWLTQPSHYTTKLQVSNSSWPYPIPSLGLHKHKETKTYMHIFFQSGKIEDWTHLI